MDNYNKKCSVFSGLPQIDLAGTCCAQSQPCARKVEFKTVRRKGCLLQSTSRAIHVKPRSRSGLRMKGGRQSAPSPGRPHAQNTKHPDSRSDTWPDRPGDAGICRSNQAATTGRRPVARWVFFFFVSGSGIER